MPKPTLTQVAAEAGVSLASASRALTGGSASAKVVARVRAVARELGYVPDSTARALRTGAPRRVVFAVDDIGNPNYVTMLRTVEATLGAAGVQVSVMSTGSTAHTASVVKQAAAIADGLIVSPIRIGASLRAAVEESVIPMVVIGNPGQGVEVDRVQTSSGRGIELAVEHLHSIGRQRMVFINGPLDTNPGRARELGYFRAARTLNLPTACHRQLVAAGFTVADGIEVGRSLLASWRDTPEEHRIDAVVAANDLIAIGVMNVATDLRIRIPDELLVTGMDDTDIAAAFNPALTSVTLHAAERGEAAAKLLLARFDDPHRPVETITVEPELVPRRSTSTEAEEVFAL